MCKSQENFLKNEIDRCKISKREVLGAPDRVNIHILMMTALFGHCV